ncbi:hypothetical protein OROGR_001768 [Orobanche gracilis]
MWFDFNDGNPRFEQVVAYLSYSPLLFQDGGWEEVFVIWDYRYLYVFQKMGKSKKQGRNNKGKISKSHKDRQRNEKNKAAAAAAASPSPAATSVSKEKENYDSHDLETVAAFKVSLADTYTYPKWTSHDVSGAAYTQLSWGPPRIPNSSSHDFETMAALGISVVCTHMFPRYDGPPIKNGADNLES